MASMAATCPMHLLLIVMLFTGHAILRRNHAAPSSETYNIWIIYFGTRIPPQTLAN